MSCMYLVYIRFEYVCGNRNIHMLSVLTQNIYIDATYCIHNCFIVIVRRTTILSQYDVQYILQTRVRCSIHTTDSSNRV